MPVAVNACKASDIVAWMPDWPLVAVQVVNYRTLRYLERCAETVVADLEGSSMAFEINLLAAEHLFTVNSCRGFPAGRPR